jgi:hypothetical protein
LLVQKKVTKEKDRLNDASTRPKKNKKITESSPDFIGKRKRLSGFSNVFFIHACAGAPLRHAHAPLFLRNKTVLTGRV